MVALLLETFPQNKAREITRKNEHYHWTFCGHSIQIYYVN